MIACVSAAVSSTSLDDWMEAHLYNAYVVAATLIIYGELFIVLENSSITANPSITKSRSYFCKNSPFIGLFELLSLIPGNVPFRIYDFRSQGTLAVPRGAAAEFSFLLGIPVMFGASF